MKLRDFILLVEQETHDDLIVEMANLGAEDHGIDHVVIQVGKANKRHGLRVKVSNLKDRWSDDNFVIQLPSLDYDHTAVAKWITGDTMKKILRWIAANSEQLTDFENDDIIYTRDFLNKITRV